MPDGDLKLWPILSPITGNVLLAPAFPQYPLPQYVSLGQIINFATFPITVAAISGAVVAMAAGDRNLFVDNVATLASLTVRLPPDVSAGLAATVCFALPVTALTVANAAGVTVAGAPTSGYGPGAAIEMRYISDARGWIYWK